MSIGEHFPRDMEGEVEARAFTYVTYGHSLGETQETLEIISYGISTVHSKFATLT